MTCSFNIWLLKYLSSCIAQFQDQHPGIRIIVIATDERHDLTRREADIALRATNHPPDFLVGRKAQEFYWHVFASKSYLENAKKSIKNLPRVSFADGSNHLILRRASVGTPYVLQSVTYLFGEVLPPPAFDEKGTPLEGVRPEDRRHTTAELDQDA